MVMSKQSFEAENTLVTEITGPPPQSEYGQQLSTWPTITPWRPGVCDLPLKAPRASVMLGSGGALASKGAPLPRPGGGPGVTFPGALLVPALA